MRKHHVRISLPWPSFYLSPNCRSHWSVHWKYGRAFRGQARILTLEALKGKRVCPIGRSKVEVQMFFFPPRRGKYDEDNLIARMKTGIDGIASAIRVDDSRFHYRESFIKTPGKPGHVEVHLYWKEEH